MHDMSGYDKYTFFNAYQHEPELEVTHQGGNVVVYSQMNLCEFPLSTGGLLTLAIMVYNNDYDWSSPKNSPD